ncbi:MAG TPA: PIN domain-containing protein [Thermoanaerobaculia bacterium]
MIEKVFVDSNVLVYAHDADAGAKQRIAANAVAEILDARSGVLSIQVLQEFYSTVTRKLRSAVTREVARELLRGYSSWTIQPLTADDVVTASFLEQRHQLSFWDALIVQTAVLAGAKRLLSENFQHGRSIGGVVVENPFTV